MKKGALESFFFLVFPHFNKISEKQSNFGDISIEITILVHRVRHNQFYSSFLFISSNKNVKSNKIVNFIELKTFF